MWILKQIFEFIRLLHTETDSWQLGLGIVFGVLLGWTPVDTLHWYLLFLGLFFIRANLGAFMITLAVMKPVSYLLDPLFDKLGFELLSVEAIKPLGALLFNSPLFPFTRLNNSVVLGSLLCFLLCAYPLYKLSLVLILKYRLTVVTRLRGSMIFRAWKASKLYHLYQKYLSVRYGS